MFLMVSNLIAAKIFSQYNFRVQVLIFVFEKR